MQPPLRRYHVQRPFAEVEPHLRLTDRGTAKAEHLVHRLVFRRVGEAVRRVHQVTDAVDAFQQEGMLGGLRCGHGQKNE